MSSPVTRVAVLGCGTWGRNLVRTFHDLGALAAIHDVDTVAAVEMSARFGAPLREFDDILADPLIDAVVVAVPAAQHSRVAQDCLAAGKHVFVEKPLALAVSEAEQLCKMADASGRVLMVGHLLQYHPAFCALETLVLEGTLGRLLYLYSNRLNFGRFRREENILWSFAPHDISMMLRLARATPASVSAIGASYLHPGIADVTTTHLTFADGLSAHIFVSWLHPYKEQRLVAVGDRGMIVFDDGLPWDSKLCLYPHQVDWRNGLPQPAKAEGQVIAVKPEEPLAVECRHFLSCCATGAVPRTDGPEGVRVLRVLDAAQESMAAGGSAVGASDGRPTSDFFAHESACIDQPCEIGPGTRIWHFSHVLAGVRLGRDCVIGQNVMIGPDVTIGDRCKIQNNVSVYRGVTLEDGVFCGPSAVFTNVRNPRAEVDRSDEFLPTRVERGATIGANATIVCGTRVGAYSFVAAGAVVTEDVPSHALVAGVPASRIGWVSTVGERLGDDLVCPRTGRRYREVGGGLAELSE